MQILENHDIMFDYKKITTFLLDVRNVHWLKIDLELIQKLTGGTQLSACGIVAKVDWTHQIK
jgi:hypothetical protein